MRVLTAAKATREAAGKKQAAFLAARRAKRAVKEEVSCGVVERRRGNRSDVHVNHPENTLSASSLRSSHPAVGFSSFAPLTYTVNVRQLAPQLNYLVAIKGAVLVNPVQEHAAKKAGSDIARRLEVGALG